VVLRGPDVMLVKVLILTCIVKVRGGTFLA
jgi:hypothetical protein